MEAGSVPQGLGRGSGETQGVEFLARAFPPTWVGLELGSLWQGEVWKPARSRLCRCHRGPVASCGRLKRTVSHCVLKPKSRASHCCCGNTSWRSVLYWFRRRWLPDSAWTTCSAALRRLQLCPCQRWRGDFSERNCHAQFGSLSRRPCRTQNLQESHAGSSGCVHRPRGILRSTDSAVSPWYRGSLSMA